MARVGLIVWGLVLALSSGTAWAETPQAPEGSGYYIREYAEIASAPAGQPWWGMTFDLVVKLGLVVGLIYLTMWALRRYVLGPQAAKANATVTGRLEVLDTTVLGPNRTVYLVEVADRVLVLGATGASLSTLAEIREPEAIDLLKRRPVVEAEAAPSFADHLRTLTDYLPANTSTTAFLGDKIGELRSLAGSFRRTPASEPDSSVRSG